MDARPGDGTELAVPPFSAAARLDAIFQRSPIPIQIIAADGRIVAVNAAWCRLWDVSAELARTFIAAGANVLRDPLLIALGLTPIIERALRGEATPDTTVYYEPRRANRRGRPRHIQTHFENAPADAGCGAELVLSFRDVSEHLADAEQVRAKQEQLDAVINHSTALIYIKDRARQYLLTNRAWLRLFGDEAGGNAQDRVIFPPEVAAQLEANDRHVLDTGEALHIEEVVPQGGRPHTYLTTKFPLRGPDGTVYAVGGISTDITERKAAELERAQLVIDARAAQQAAALKGQFLAMASHEIRTPLGGIMGLADLLEHTALSAEQRTHVASITELAQGLLGILNDILDFSKLEAGKLQFESSDFDLAAELARVDRALSASASAKGLQLSWETACPTPAGVRGDAMRLRQVLINLVGNAIKFSPAGTVHVRTALTPRAEGDYALRVEVQDQGVGIAADAVPRLFAAFSQADATTSRRFGGTGLGLAICRAIVEGMGGRIGVDSVEGQGATFWFTLTLGRAAQPAVAAAATTPPPAPAVRLRGRVLVAEDNRVNQTVILAQLRRLGVAADVVADGAAAVAAATATPYDVVLMDCHMPEVDGYEATRRLRAHAATAALPIVALTANAMQGERERCLAAGMTDYLVKPVAPPLLLAALQRYLGSSPA